MPRDMRRLIACAALGWMSAASAAVASLPASAPATPDEVRVTLGAAMVRFEARDCPGVLALLDPVAPRVAPGKERIGVQLLRLRCLGAVGRASELPALQQELAQLAPRDPGVRSLGVLISVDAGRFGDAADRMGAIAAEQPAVLALIPGAVWRAVAQKLTEAGDTARRGKVLVALAEADWQPLDRPEMRDDIARGAIEVLLGQGNLADADALLNRVEMPELLADMAIERRYQPLWPAIEARLGAHEAAAVDRFAAARLAVFANSPNDARARRDAIRAFILLGRLDDAVDVGSQVMIVPGLSEDDVDAVSYEAQALAALGDRSKAAARLRAVAALDINRAPEAAGAIVSLAEMLDEAGQPDAALAAAREGIARGGVSLSPWGIAWLKRTEVCALSSLGRAAEAKAAGDRLEASAPDNQAAAIEGLLCARRIDEAAAIAIATLATRDGAGRIADQFQPQGASWAAAPSRLRALWAPLLGRRDVKAAFARSARILPRNLWPSSEPRPVPRAATAPDAGPTT